MGHDAQVVSYLYIRSALLPVAGHRVDLNRHPDYADGEIPGQATAVLTAIDVTK